MAPAGQSSSNQRRRRRVNLDLDAEYMYHNGGALYIPRPPSPEPVPSVAMPPDSVPSEASMPLPDPILSVHVATSDDVNVAEESHQSPVIKEEHNTNRGRERRNSNVSSEKLSESEEDYQSSEDEEESEDDSSLYSSNYNKDASEPLADETRKLKRKHQEDRSQQEEDSDGLTRPSKRYRIGSKDIEKWNQRLEELKTFKEKHGHCRAPQSIGALHHWLYNQRTKNLNPNHSRYLKDVSERERRTKELESVLGAKLRDWTSLPSIKSSSEANKWDARLKELKTFKEKYGHCRVPQSIGALHHWLYNQRTKNLNPNHSLCLKDAPERERRAKELESVFGANLRDLKSPQRTLDAVNWDGRLEELKKFKTKHGHCKVTSSSGLLYAWLGNQRKDSRCLKDARERERRTKALESVLGASLQGGQSKAELTSTELKRTRRTRGSTRRQTGR